MKIDRSTQTSRSGSRAVTPIEERARSPIMVQRPHPARDYAISALKAIMWPAITAVGNYAYHVGRNYYNNWKENRERTIMNNNTITDDPTPNQYGTT